MLNRLYIIFVILLSAAVVTATSLCLVEGSVHAAETESHALHRQQHEETTGDNASHPRPDESSDACCQNLLAYTSAIPRTPVYFPVVLKAPVFNPRTTASEFRVKTLAKPFPRDRTGFSNRSWERYALSNPPKAPPFI